MRVSEVSGSVFVLEANLYNNPANRKITEDDAEHQRIKVFYCDKKKETIFTPTPSNLIIQKEITEYQNLNNLFSSDDDGADVSDVFPRITKIRIDDRGILALTDINNNKVHLLKESMKQEFKIKNIDDMALNKVTIK